MRENLFIIGLILASLVLQGCDSAVSQSSKTENKSATPQPQQEISKQQKVEFKGVSFSYNPRVFGEIKSEEIAEYPLQEETFKPDGVAPQHRLFTFDLATDFSPMYIAVYPVSDFPRMYAVNKSSVKAMEEEIINLQKVLQDKNFRVKGHIPYLPFIDASQSFQSKVRHFPFQNGRGILFLTHWSFEIEFVSNRQLRYVFEGLTNDGKYYVLAEMPVSVAFLSDDSPEEFEGYKIPWEKLKDETEMKRFNEVNKGIGRRLENLKPNEFKPNLDYLEEIISSLKIEK